MQKAWFSEEYGPKEVLKLGNLPIPTPQYNQVLVQVNDAALNRIDFKRCLCPIFPSEFPVSTKLEIHYRRQYYVSQHLGSNLLSYKDIFISVFIYSLCTNLIT